MRIDWGALLPADRADAAPPALLVQTHAPEASDTGAGNDADREAWEERAAIIEFDGGKDRQTAEALASAEGRIRERAAAWAARAGDDRRYCPECGHYRVRFCTIAKPGGLVSASRNYEPVPDILHRCEGFAPLPDDPDQRPGVERWPWLMQPPFRADMAGHATARTPANSPAGRASG